ncbi:MAG: hypothetical protein ACI9GW_002216 [Halieaceae bacterium]|jgi:hypothetical protein
MSINVLELADTGLRLWRDEELVHSSPGYALLQAGQLVFGEPAMAQARLRPREVEHRYWSELSLDPLKADFGGKRHFADLAHAHLLDIASQSGCGGDTIAVVPGGFRREQLALLLGIIKESPFRAVALVDGAIASAAAEAPPGDSMLLELHLHKAVATQLHNQGGEVSRGEVSVIPGLGLIAIKERLASAIAVAFIEETRFDPRHKASVEQQLFDELPTILDNLRAESQVKIELAGYTARLNAEHMATSCADSFQRIADALNKNSSVLLLGEDLARLPGINALFDPLRYIALNSAARSVLEHREDLVQDTDALEFVTTLPASLRSADAGPAPIVAEPAAPAPQALATPDNTATHLLFKHSAYPLSGNGTVKESGVPLHSETSLAITGAGGQVSVNVAPGDVVSVNGNPAVTGQRLHRGDLIMLGDSGEVLQLISVRGPDGT